MAVAVLVELAAAMAATVAAAIVKTVGVQGATTAMAELTTARQTKVAELEQRVAAASSTKKSNDALGVVCSADVVAFELFG